METSVEATERQRCIGIVEKWSQNRYTRGWYQSAAPRQCKNRAASGEKLCLYHRRAGRTIENTPIGPAAAC